MSFCTLEIPNVETAAVLQELLDKPFKEHLRNTVLLFPFSSIQGERKGYEAIVEIADKYKRKYLWQPLQTALMEVGADYLGTNAPWMKSAAPSKIENFNIAYDEDGVEFGCSKISLKTMKLMVEKCEAKGE